ncbi:Outer membrane protein [Marinactinospora thermotolerans DSM 45154]|uniref:Outer membrane protein n=2 Tax=Marinactinospora thermotolerans TaxID=531310 RepID=A0A1T4QCL6_9ACTN|nr:Outer membrane protein [Marinactinospora thermotolerans DSM 45154]
MPEIVSHFHSRSLSPVEVEQIIREQWALWHRSNTLNNALDVFTDNGTDVPWTMRIPPALPWLGNGEEPDGVGMQHARRFDNDQEAIDWAQTIMPSPNLMEDSYDALETYAADGYEFIKAGLREGKVVVQPGQTRQEAEQSLTELVANIDAGIAESTLPESVILHRGVNWDYIERMLRDRHPNMDPRAAAADPRILQSLVGMTFTDTSYASTSIGTHSPMQRDAYFMIRAPKGHPAINLMDISKVGTPEREILLPRGTKFIIHAVYPRRAPLPQSLLIRPQLFFEIEIVPTSWNPPPGWRPAPLGDADRGYWNADRVPDDNPIPQLISDATLDQWQGAGGTVQIHTALTDPGDAPQPDSDGRDDRGPRVPVDEARSHVSRAQADVVRFETNLENTRSELGLADDDLTYLGGLVEAAQLRVTAAQAEIDLAQARLDDARGSRMGTETARAELARAQTELRNARTGLDQARERFIEAGGTIDRTPSAPPTAPTLGADGGSTFRGDGTGDVMVNTSIDPPQPPAGAGQWSATPLGGDPLSKRVSSASEASDGSDVIMGNDSDDAMDVDPSDGPFDTVDVSPLLDGIDDLEADDAAALLRTYYDHHVNGQSLDTVFGGDTDREEQYLNYTRYWQENGALLQALHNLSDAGIIEPPGGWERVANSPLRTAALSDELAERFGSRPGQTRDFAVPTGHGAVLPARITQRGSFPDSTHPRFEWNRIPRVTPDGRDTVETVVRLERLQSFAGPRPDVIVRAENELVRAMEAQINDGRIVTYSNGASERIPYTLRNGAELRLRVELVDRDQADRYRLHGHLDWGQPALAGTGPQPNHTTAVPDVLSWFGLTESGASQATRTGAHDAPPARVTAVSLSRISALTAESTSRPAPVYDNLVDREHWKDARDHVPVTVIGARAGSSGVERQRGPELLTTSTLPGLTTADDPDGVPVPGNPDGAPEFVRPADLHDYKVFAHFEVRRIPIPEEFRTPGGPSHVRELTVRIKFRSDEVDPDVAARSLRDYRETLEAAWNYRHRLPNEDGSPGDQLHFTVEEAGAPGVTGPTHRWVKWVPSVDGEIPRATMRIWPVDGPPIVPLHETGHMYGLVDEYFESDNPGLFRIRPDQSRVDMAPGNLMSWSHLPFARLRGHHLDELATLTRPALDRDTGGPTPYEPPVRIADLTEETAERIGTPLQQAAPDVVDDYEQALAFLGAYLDYQRGDSVEQVTENLGRYESPADDGGTRLTTPDEKWQMLQQAWNAWRASGALDTALADLAALNTSPFSTAGNPAAARPASGSASDSARSSDDSDVEMSDGEAPRAFSKPPKPSGANPAHAGDSTGHVSGNRVDTDALLRESQANPTLDVNMARLSTTAAGNRQDLPAQEPSGPPSGRSTSSRGMRTGQPPFTSDDARTWLDRRFPVPPLTDDQRAYLRFYRAHGSDTINKALQSDHEPTDSLRKAVDNLDSAFQHWGLPESVILFRGANSDLAHRMGASVNDPASMHGLVGKVHTEPGYLSTSAIPHSDYTARRIYVMFRAPAGYPALNAEKAVRNGQDEQEVLLRRDSSFVIHAVAERPDPYGMKSWFIEAELVPDGWTPPPGWTPTPYGANLDIEGQLVLSPNGSGPAAGTGPLTVNMTVTDPATLETGNGTRPDAGHHDGASTTTGPDPSERAVDEARAEVAQAQADVVQFETDLETLRTNFGIAGDDLYYLGGLVEAAQLRVTAAEAEVNLAQARLNDARGSRMGTQTARQDLVRAQTELRNAHDHLGQTRDRFVQAGGGIRPDGSPDRPAPAVFDVDPGFPWSGSGGPISQMAAPGTMPPPVTQPGQDNGEEDEAVPSAGEPPLGDPGRDGSGAGPEPAETETAETQPAESETAKPEPPSMAEIFRQALNGGNSGN